MADPKKLASMFKALSVDTRIRVLQLLKDRALCVGALARRLGISSAAVSQHLRILRDADLVVSDKQGYFVHYRLNSRTLHVWRDRADALLSPPED